MAITKIQSESLNLADDYAFTGTITGTPIVNHINSWTIDSTTALSADTNTVVANWSQYYNFKGSTMTESAGAFTFPATGIYRVVCSLAVYRTSGVFIPYIVSTIQQSTDSGSSYSGKAVSQNFIGSDSVGNRWHQCHTEVDIQVTDATTNRLRITVNPSTGDCNIEAGNTSYIHFMKIADI